MFPIVGVTALLNLLAGHVFRLNHALMQTINQLVGPLHLVMIFVYLRLGETIWGASADRFSFIELVTDFHALPFGEFLQRFGWAAVHAITAWALTAPLLYLLISRGTRPALRRLAKLLPVRSSKSP